jgi:hypothetical protein
MQQRNSYFGFSDIRIGAGHKQSMTHKELWMCEHARGFARQFFHARLNGS